jgi:hypothetical protein
MVLLGGLMASVLFGVITAGIFFVLVSFTGARMGKGGKPYNPGMSAAHKILSILVITGLIVSAYKLHGAIGGKLYLMIALHTAAAAALVNIIIGAVLSGRKSNGQGLIVAHKVFTAITAAGFLAAIVFVCVKM